MNSLILIVGALYLLLALAGQLFFKRAAGGINTDSMQSFVASTLSNWQLWVAVITYLFAMIAWVWLLKHIDLSRIFPIMSALLLLTIPLISAYFLQESLSLRYWLGIVCMVIGIMLIATEIKTI